MGARGLGNLTNLFQDGEESEKEKREREARNAGAAIGTAAGIIAGMAIGLTQDDEKVEETDGEGEREGFDISM